ncbi:MAG: acetyl-CoA C-acetyltransferase [Bdellovibrionota bacterium]
MKSIVVVSGKRTPFGAFGGSLKDVSATDLGVAASKAAMEQAKISPDEIDHIVMGTVVQAAKDAIYLPRHIGLKAGIPMNRGALGVNRLCGSGFQSWINAVQMIQTGESEVVLAGGVEQMSQIPYILRGARWGYRMGQGEVEDYLTAALTDSYTGTPMAITAENLAEQYKISRDDVDQFALSSQKKYKAAFDKKYFDAEISPVTIVNPKGNVVVTKDEHPRPETTIEGLQKLKPLFKKEGTVTAGTASGIVDGACASILMSEDEAKRRNLKPMARIVSYASVGCDPKIMGIGPVYAIQNALKKANMKLEQMDLIEVNEAFGAQFLSVQKELKFNPEITNVNGGAIAVGHPLGASGTRIMNHLMYELERRNKKFGVGSACIGGGQGIAIVIERL